MTDLSTMAISLLAVYTAVLLFLSYLAAKRTKSMEDFAIGGEDVGGAAAGLAVFASFASAASYLGIPALLYNQGVRGL